MSRPTRIKICGVTTREAARAAAAAGADAIGLVFASGSPRGLDADTAAALLESIPPLVTTVGVYRDLRPESDPMIGRVDVLQLHGDEDEALIAGLARPVIRGFPFSPEAVARWDACPNVSALLVDGPRGGAGETFDHGALAALAERITRPVVLAGGLTPENVGEAIRTVRPYAVDVSSGVERAPGIKDPELIAAFCVAVRQADGCPPGPAGNPR
ncbi:MAG: phosphoribosylanthranilate isomerase [Planctomycetes bacterium]|nr:phosphoribosylanthranilate isomerase [Planctomycetota bacterium]